MSSTFDLWSENQLPRVTSFLKSYGAEIINVRSTKSKITLLMKAASPAWSVEGFKALLELPSLDVDAQSYPEDGWDNLDCHKYSALMIAATQLQVEKVQLLLQCGARANLTNSCFNSALHCVVSSEQNRFDPEKSHEITQAKCAIIDLLLKAGADINQRGWKNQTPLMNAIDNSDDIDGAVVAHLLQRGADISLNAKSDYNCRDISVFEQAKDKPHMLAVLKKHLESTQKTTDVTKHRLGILGYLLLNNVKKITGNYENAGSNEINSKTLADQIQQLIETTQAQLREIVDKGGSKDDAGDWL
jgi:hypothetical protein